MEKFCSECGCALQFDTKFCNNCGRRLLGPSSIEVEKHQSSPLDSHVRLNHKLWQHYLLALAGIIIMVSYVEWSKEYLQSWKNTNARQRELLGVSDAAKMRALTGVTKSIDAPIEYADYDHAAAGRVATYLSVGGIAFVITLPLLTLLHFRKWSA